MTAESSQLSATGPVLGAAEFDATAPPESPESAEQADRNGSSSAALTKSARVSSVMALVHP